MAFVNLTEVRVERCTVLSCLLDVRNEMRIDNTTVGGMIAKTGKSRLWGEREGAAVDTIVVHYISAIETNPRRWFDPKSIMPIYIECGVSSHYMIDRDGVVYRLVPEAMRAWHCGGSIMPAPDNRRSVNEFSIGVELIATDDSGFTGRQYCALGRLCREIEERYGAMRYVGHQDVAGARAVELGLRTEPKIDPGPLFEWRRFFQEKG